MLVFRIFALVILLLLTARTAAMAAGPAAQQSYCDTPLMRTVSPDTGEAGSRHVVVGECLGTAHVRQLFLTLNGEDVQVEILEQSDITLHFRIPVRTRAGRYTLMILTAGKNPKLIEQPVKLVVMEKREPEILSER